MRWSPVPHEYLKERFMTFPTKAVDALLLLHGPTLGS